MGLSLFVGAICGVIAALVAARKGRNTVGWFFGGFFLGLIGLIIVCCLPNLNAEKARREHDARERRRLREQLRQERIKHEAFRRHAAQRLDAHDGALGIDTRSTTPLPDAASPALLESGQDQVAAPPPPTNVWYYEIGGETKGPVGELDIKRMIRSKEVIRTTLLWSEALGEWTPADEVPEFVTTFLSS